MRIDLEHYKDEARHKARQVGKDTAGTVLTATIRALTGGGATAVAVAVRNGLATGSTYMFGMLGIAASVLVRVYLNDQEHQREKERLRDMYRKEVSNLLGKDEHAVTTEDFMAVARKNPSLSLAVDRSNHGRYFENTVAILATAAAFGSVLALMPAALAAAGGISATLFGVTVGITAFEVGKWLFTKIGNVLLDVSKPTAVSVIGRLEKKAFTSHVKMEEVMEVYALSSPHLATRIREEMGKPYSRLSDTQKSEAIARTGMLDEIGAVTLAINENRMNPRELAFRIHGQRSGISADPNIRARFNDTVSHLKERIHNGRTYAMERFSTFAENLQSRFQDVGQGFRSKISPQETSFAEREAVRGGRSKSADMGWGEYVEQTPRGGYNRSLAEQ